MREKHESQRSAPMCVCTAVAVACMLMQNIPFFMQPTVVGQNKRAPSSQRLVRSRRGFRADVNCAIFLGRGATNGDVGHQRARSRGQSA